MADREQPAGGRRARLLRHYPEPAQGCCFIFLLLVYGWYHTIVCLSIILAHEPRDQRIILQHVHQSAWDEKIQGADSELKEDRQNMKVLYGFVKHEELCFFGLPDELNDETPEVQALNRGLNTIHNRMMMLRRRYGCLLKHRKASTGVGKLVKKKMDSYKKELVIMRDQIVAKGGKYCMTPEIFDEDIVLID